MNKRDYPPLLKEGFKKIAFWQMDELFLNPFIGNEHRKYLIDRFRVFLMEFHKLEIDAEIWIDGSFTTEKPEPKDIDVVFFLNPNDIVNLPESKQNVFSLLFIDRETVLARYGLDIYFADISSEEERLKWEETFSLDNSGLNKKGIFKLFFKKDADYTKD
jgi:hypothetical protein